MYDVVDASKAPATGDLFAGYVDGRWRSYPQLVAHFPRSIVVPIAVFAQTQAGTVLDVERYDATPTQAPGWCRERRFAGVDPTVYCSLSVWPAVRAQFEAQGVPEPHYWIADWTGAPHTVTGAVAVQWQSTADYDISLVSSYWPGVDPLNGGPDVPAPSDIVRHVVTPDGYYHLKASGEVDKVGTWHPYAIVGNDGDVYQFPTGDAWQYPDLPPELRQGTRYFLDLWLTP